MYVRYINLVGPMGSLTSFVPTQNNNKTTNSLNSTALLPPTSVASWNLLGTSAGSGRSTWRCSHAQASCSESWKLVFFPLSPGFARKAWNFKLLPQILQLDMWDPIQTEKHCQSNNGPKPIKTVQPHAPATKSDTSTLWSHDCFEQVWTLSQPKWLRTFHSSQCKNKHHWWGYRRSRVVSLLTCFW